MKNFTYQLYHYFYGREDADKEYKYLLGQTFPFRNKKQQFYPMATLGYTVGNDGKPVPWTNNKQTIANFIQIGIHSGILEIKDTQKGKVVEYSPIIKEVIHKDGLDYDE